MGQKVTRRIHIVTVVFWLAVLTTPALTATKSKPKPRIKVFLNTGAEVVGDVYSSSKGSLRIKTKKKTVSVFWLNILSMDRVDTDGNVLKEGNTAVDRGKAFLDAGMKDDAAYIFVKAIKKKPALKKEIERIYQRAETPLPIGLGGEAKDGERLLAMKHSALIPTIDEVKFSIEQAKQWGTAAKSVAKLTHLIETEHFMIYSAWSKKDDKRLRQIYEKLYSKLCSVFAVNPKENIWIGKLPVFAFWKRQDFVRFAVETAGAPPTMAARAGGFAGTRYKGGKPFHYVVLGEVKPDGVSKQRATTWFYELLIHETTHAFNYRYINDKRIPSWMNEGMAETMSALMIPKCSAARKLRYVTKTMSGTGNAYFESFFAAGNIPMSDGSYGLAHSLIRYLRSRGPQKLRKLYEEVKGGKTDDEALKSVYGFSRMGLASRWRKAAGKVR